MWPNPRRGEWPWRECLKGCLGAWYRLISSFFAPLFSCKVFTTACNFSQRLVLLYFSFFFFSFFSFFLTTTRVPHGGFHPNFLPWAPLRDFSPRDLILFLFLLISNPLTTSWRFSISEPISGNSEEVFTLDLYFSLIFIFLFLFFLFFPTLP